MTNAEKIQECDEASGDLSRREFVALSVGAGLGIASGSGVVETLPVAETEVDIKTPDGVCDAVFIHPVSGSYPGVLIWHDSLGLRPVIRNLGKRIAAEGYSTLVPNLFYRAARAPVFDSSFDYARNAADREKYARIAGPFFTPGAAERDAAAYVEFLDAQRQVNKERKIGTHGYPNALHGWCVPDSKAAANKQDADRAWAKLIALYRSSL